MNTTQESTWMTPLQVLDELGIALNTQAQYRTAKSDKAIPFRKVGRKVLYKRAELYAWIDAANPSKAES